MSKSFTLLYVYGMAAICFVLASFDAIYYGDSDLVYAIMLLSGSLYAMAKFLEELR